MMTSTHAYDLLALPEQATAQLGTVSRIMSAGKPDKFFSRLADRYGLRMMRLYGLSEVGTHVIASLDDEAAGDSDGLPLPGTEVRVVDPDTGLSVSPGTIGELQTRGPSMGLGYHGGLQTSSSLTEDRFWRTGDLATIDKTGHVRISGRLKDSIRRGGININPEEMEGLLFRHPSVFEGCLVGSPDERLGQLVNAVVVLRDDRALTLDEMRGYLEGNGIPRRELPDRLFVVDHIPRTDLGRLSKRLLAVKIPELAP
jgi:acyl-CoA synthetase (AMP-forming)/AMP-acid ligase II